MNTSYCFYKENEVSSSSNEMYFANNLLMLISFEGILSLIAKKSGVPYKPVSRKRLT